VRVPLLSSTIETVIEAVIFSVSRNTLRK